MESTAQIWIMFKKHEDKRATPEELEQLWREYPELIEFWANYPSITLSDIVNASIKKNNRPNSPLATPKANYKEIWAFFKLAYVLFEREDDFLPENYNLTRDDFDMITSAFKFWKIQEIPKSAMEQIKQEFVLFSKIPVPYFVSKNTSIYNLPYDNAYLQKNLNQIIIKFVLLYPQIESSKIRNYILSRYNHGIFENVKTDLAMYVSFLPQLEE